MKDFTVYGKDPTLVQCWATVCEAGPAWATVGYLKTVFQLINVAGAQRVQVGGVAPDKEHLLSGHPTWTSLNRHWSIYM